MTSTATELKGTEDALAHVERETERFVLVARRSPLAAHVPTYPDFTVGTLAAHIGRALRFFGVIVLSDEPVEPSQVVAPEGAAVLDWVEEGLPPLLSLLRETPADKVVSLPHGIGEQPVSTIAPGLAVEVGVHRWDVESVLGEHAPIPAELAVTEVERAFGSYASRLAGAGVAPIGGTLEFRATDVDLGWTGEVDEGRLRIGRTDVGSPEADTVVSASIEDLALVAWKRWPPPRAGVEVSGPVDVLKRFLASDYIPDPRTTPAH